MPEQPLEDEQQSVADKIKLLANYKIEDINGGEGVKGQEIVAPKVPVTDIYPHSSATKRGTHPDDSVSNPITITKKKLIPGMMIALIAVVIVCAGLVSADYIYQQPQKVLADSVVNLFTSDAGVYSATVNVSDSSGKSIALVNITTKTSDDKTSSSLKASMELNYQDSKYRLEGEAMVVKGGDLYFKFSGLDEIVSQMKSSLGGALDQNASQSIDNLVEQIDNVWVKVSSEDLQDFSSTAASGKNCLTETMEKYKNDDSATAELTEIYNKNQFVVMKNDLGLKDGSLGYSASLDGIKLNGYFNDFKGTKYYKSLHECDSSFNIENVTFTNTPEKIDSKNYFHVWVDFFSHRLTRVEIAASNDSSSVTANIVPDYNQKVEIKAPASSISLATLKSYIDQMIQDLGFGSNLQSSQSRANAQIVQSLAEIGYADTGHYPSRISEFTSNPSYSFPSDITVVANPALINSANGATTISWSCLTSCTNASGGRVGYFDYNNNAVALIYVGDGTAGGAYVNPSP